MSGLVLPIGDTAEIGDLKVCSKNADHGKWLKCTDGRTVSRTTYALLFAEIGTTYGSGNGSTTFGLPSPEGRALGIAGSGSGLTVRNINDRVGSENQAITVAQMPSHNFKNGIADDGGNNPFVYGATSSGSPGSASQPVGGAGGSIIQQGLTETKGSGQAHNNMQPTYFAGNLFIYAGK